MIALKKELKERKTELQTKIDSDTAIYGKPLGNKVLQDKVDATKRKITRHQASIDKLQVKINDRNMKKHKLSTWDNRVLDAIRGKREVHNTSTENTYRYDHRFRGSANSRRLSRR